MYIIYKPIKLDSELIFSNQEVHFQKKLIYNAEDLSLQLIETLETFFSCGQEEKVEGRKRKKKVRFRKKTLRDNKEKREREQKKEQREGRKFRERFRKRRKEKCREKDLEKVR